MSMPMNESSPMLLPVVDMPNLNDLGNLTLSIVPTMKNSPPAIVGLVISGLDQIVSEAAFQKNEISRPIVKPSMFSNVNRMVWCQSPKPEYKLRTQQYNLPARCIPLVRPKNDLIMLPGNHVPTREFFDFCKRVLGIEEQQAVWTSGTIFNMDDDVDDAVLEGLRRLMGAVIHEVSDDSIAKVNESWLLMPYCPTKNFQRWAVNIFVDGQAKDNSTATVTVSTFGESDVWMSKYGDKGILHRHVRTPDVPSMIETIDPTIKVARGFVCENTEDLLKARELLLADGCDGVVIKPLSGATGQGIVLRPDLEAIKAYEFAMGPVSLEEFLAIDKAPDGSDVSPAMHYIESHILGHGMVDQIMKGTKYIGWRASSTDEEFQREATRVMQKFIEHTKPRGAGGVDFLSVNGRPVLVDINTGRFNGAHAPKLFQQMYAPETEMFCWKQKPVDQELTISILWQKFEELGIAFQPGKSKTGVFPLLFLRGLSGMYLAFGDHPGHVEELYKIADTCLNDLQRAAYQALAEQQALAAKQAQEQQQQQQQQQTQAAAQQQSTSAPSSN